MTVCVVVSLHKFRMCGTVHVCVVLFLLKIPYVQRHICVVTVHVCVVVFLLKIPYVQRHVCVVDLLLKILHVHRTPFMHMYVWFWPTLHVYNAQDHVYVHVLTPHRHTQ